jgi:hypothetical protein
MGARPIVVSLTCLLVAGCSFDALGLVEDPAGSGGADGATSTVTSGTGSTSSVGGAGGAGGTGGVGVASSSSSSVTGASTSTGLLLDPCVDGCKLANAGGCNEFIDSNDCEGCCAKIKQVAQAVGCTVKLETFLDCAAMQLAADVDVCNVTTCDPAGSTVRSCFESACGVNSGNPNAACLPLLWCVSFE